MTHARQFGGGRGGGPFGGITQRGGAPPDVIAILATVFVTFTLQFFALTAIVPSLLSLTPYAWRYGFVWQVATYPFVGHGGPSVWFVLGLVFLFFFMRDVFYQLGRTSFWKLMAWTCIPAALLALLVDAGARLIVGGPIGSQPLGIMQGQWMLWAVIITAWASLNREGTVLFMFIVPIRAMWFVLLTIVLAFLGFLGTKDFAGFLGICAAVGLTYSFLTPGGLRRLRREGWLRLQSWWLRRKMKRLREKRGFTVVGDDDQDRWLN
ncbi:MAG: hypothetical protein R3234_07940 [Thermoanaerobaculia bacterium]|nr:hypothetical protein [Thermoanaerobaculia bacterium]